MASAVSFISRSLKQSVLVLCARARVRVYMPRMWVRREHNDNSSATSGCARTCVCVNTTTIQVQTVVARARACVCLRGGGWRGKAPTQQDLSLQPMAQRYRCHEHHPRGGVSAAPLSSPATRSTEPRLSISSSSSIACSIVISLVMDFDRQCSP